LFSSTNGSNPKLFYTQFEPYVYHDLQAPIDDDPAIDLWQIDETCELKVIIDDAIAR
jgi:hypothetical protein